MKSNSVLECAVFQLTPTRTRCDLYIIANDDKKKKKKKKEKIASGLLSPFIAHLKAAQDQIAQGGYSVFLTPPPASASASASPWFTKSTLQSFVRFVSTPEILERVYTIESEILQIQDAISIQGNNHILIQDQHVKPVPSSEGNKHACDADAYADDAKAIVLYKPGVPETNTCAAKEGNSKLQLLNVLETRKTVLKKEQGMAFARAVAAGFEVDHVSNLLSFAECFGASRLMSACLRFMDLWKQKHESGQWVEIETEDAMSTKSDYSASGIVLSSMTNRHDEPGGDANSESKETEGTDSYAGGQQQYQFPHPAYPPWGMMHSSSSPGSGSGSGSVPVYQPYPVPYYQQHYYSPGTAPPFYPPPPPPYPSSMEDPHFSGGQRRRQSMDNNSESEDSEQQHKNASKKKSGGRVVIRNINYITSKKQNSSEDESESASETHTDDETETETETERVTQRKRSLRRSPKRKQSSESETHHHNRRKETDSSSHWQAFQSFLLKGAEEGSPNKDMFAMEKDHQTKRRQKQQMADDDPLAAHAERDADGDGHTTDMLQSSSYERNGRKTGGSDDFIVGGRHQADVRNPLALNGFETNLDRNGMPDDETVMVSLLRSTSGGNDNRNMDNYDLPSLGSQNPDRARELLKYEPDALSLMPERAIEKRSIGGYDPAALDDYEMQLVAEDAVATWREKKSKPEAKKGGSKSAQQLIKPNQRRSLDKKFVGKGKPSTLEDARARAEKLRSFKADLQKMKKEQQDAEHKRLEALKIERQKRIAARANSVSGQPGGKKQLASKMTQRGGSKFTDSEPGSSSPLQRSKITTTTVGVGPTINSKKTSTSSSSKIVHLAGNNNNRLTRSLSSMSDRKKAVVTPPDSKVSSITHIRRLSEPKKITSLKTPSVSKPKLSNGGGPETKKKSAIMSIAASLPELKIKTSSNLLSQKLSAAKVKEDKPVAKLNLNDRRLSHHQADVDNNPIIDKSVVMLEDKQQPSISYYAKEVDSSNHEAGASSHADEIIDKGTISVQPHKHHPTPCEPVRENFPSSTEKNYQAPYARVSSFEDPSTRNSEYAKAPQVKVNFGTLSDEAYVSDFNNLKLEKIPEVVEKPPQSKGGFRRLLKLGKKSHSPSDTSSDNPASASASTQVNTLKTLISEDQTPTHGHASQKSSRHFSLLSSFRGKATEKKPST